MGQLDDLKATLTDVKAGLDAHGTVLAKISADTDRLIAAAGAGDLTEVQSIANDIKATVDAESAALDALDAKVPEPPTT